MLKLMGKKILKVLSSKSLLILTYVKVEPFPPAREVFVMGEEGDRELETYLNYSL